MTSVKSQAEQTQPDFRVWVKTRLLETGLDVTKLAAQLGQSRVNVSTAINHPTLRHDLKLRIKKTLSAEEDAA